MGLTATVVALGCSLCLLLLLAILDRRPYRPGRLNPVPLMIVLAIACLVLGKQLADQLR